MFYNKVIQIIDTDNDLNWINLVWIFPAPVSWQQKVSPMKIPSLRDPRTFFPKCLLREHIFSEREQRGHFNHHVKCGSWSNELFHWLILRNRLKINQWAVTFYLCFTGTFVWTFSFAVDLQFWLPALHIPRYSNLHSSPELALFQ